MSPQAAYVLTILGGCYLLTGWAPLWWVVIGTVVVDFVRYLRDA